MLFRKIMNSTEESEPIEPSDNRWYTNFLNIGGNTTSGEYMNPQSAFSNIGIIFQCIVIRANAISKLPLQLYKEDANGKHKDKSHNIWYLIEKRPNRYQTPSQFKSFIEVSRCLWGNAFIKMEFDRKGNVIALLPLDPSKMKMDKLNGNYYYIYTNDNGEVETFIEEELIHIPYISLDGKIGKSPMEVAREQAGNLQAITKFEGGFYKNGAMNTGVIEAPAQLSPESKKKIKNEWQNLYGGSANAGSVAVLDAGFGYKQLNLPMKDIEFIASRKMNKTEIATIFDVPLYMLNEGQGDKLGTVEQQNLRFLNDVLQSTLTITEEEFNYKVFTYKDSKSYYVKFNLNAMLRADSKTRAEYYKTMQQNGNLNINEVRDLEDMNSIGELGDKYYMSLNFTTVDTIEDHERIKKGETDNAKEE